VDVSIAIEHEYLKRPLSTLPKENKNMKELNKFMESLLAVFPTDESLSKFASDSSNLPALQSFVDFAKRNNLIKNNDFNSLSSFIAQHARKEEDCTPPAHLTFSKVIEKKEELLKFNLSVRSLIDRINSLMKDNKIALPPVSNPMLTRLKTKPADTISKQNALRSLAFWLGHERTELGPKWNFETLMKLCPKDKPNEQFKEGVRIGFALYSRGDVIDHSVMNWLKKAIRDYLDHMTGGTLNGQWGKIYSHDFTTLYINLPKESISSDPASYRPCLKNAVALTHQVAIRWILSKHFSQKRFLSIGIVAGEFNTLDSYLFPILSAKLSGDPTIRVSDYVRQCLLITDIRVILCQHPSETTLFNGEVLRIWWLTAFWSALYFDFIQDLLEDDLLKKNLSDKETPPPLLGLPQQSGFENLENDKTNAINTFLRFPHNSILGTEIAKTLYYRRRFQEAIEVLRIILSIDPTDTTARTLRMNLLRELALDAPSYSVADIFFRQAEHEALYIIENCASKSEYFFCEYALLYLTKAVMTLRYLRNSDKGSEPLYLITQLKNTVYNCIDAAEYRLQEAVAVSPFAIRSSFYLNVVRVLRTILKNDEELFTNAEKPIDGSSDIMARPSAERLWQLMPTRGTFAKEDNIDFIEKLFVKRFKIHEESISLRSYRPNAHFSHAIALWDFSLQRTLSIATRVLDILNEAIQLAEIAAKDELCICSTTRINIEIMPAEEFICHIRKSIKVVKSVVGENTTEKDGRKIIHTPANVPSSLMTLNF